MTNPPNGIERLTPREAWEDGYRSGRESLALAYQGDKEVREAQEGRTTDRLDTIERNLMVLASDAQDRARSIADIVRRIGLLEDQDQQRVATDRNLP